MRLRAIHIKEALLSSQLKYKAQIGTTGNIIIDSVDDENKRYPKLTALGSAD